MFNKDLFDKEVANILEHVNTKDSVDIKEKLYIIYELANNIEKASRKDTHKLVSEILQYLFQNNFSNTYSIPIDFVESEVGRVIFTLKFGISETVYTASAVAAIVGISRMWVSKEVANGLLRASKKGQGNSIIVYERDLIRYMQSRDISQSEIEARIAQYYKLKDQGLSDEGIKEIINKK